MSNILRAVAYLRVSSSSQSTNRQLNELKKVEGFEIVNVCKEKISGYSVPAEERKELQRALKILKEDRSIDALMISEISRLGRNTREVLSILDELEKEEIALYIHNLGTTIGGANIKDQAFAKLIVTIMADLARLESEQLSERIKSGIRSRKEKGLSTGRKIGSNESSEKFLTKHQDIRKYIEKGYSSREIQKICKCGPGTIQKVKALI
ncbi:MAG: recombinase family protein [Cyclobacteriaceae bacterium]